MIGESFRLGPMLTGARFSDDKKYRYLLWRTWNVNKLPMVFIMLNPSTADAVKNDPTVERCERRARAAGYGGLVVANIFALRSTDPKRLYSVGDPVGVKNDAEIIQAAMGSGMVICAWGDHGDLGGRGTHVMMMLRERGVRIFHIGRNKSGHPRHPLYVSYKVQPKEWL